MSRWNIERAIFASDLTSPARLVLLALCALSDAKTGEIPDEFMPSLSRLTAMTGLGRSTVVRELAALEKAGWIKRKRPPIAKARSQGARTRYWLKVPKGSPAVGLPSPESTDSASPAVGPPSATAGLPLVPERDSGSPTAGHVLTALNQAEPQQRSRAAEQIVMEHTGANPTEAAAIVNRVRNERNPRSLGGLLRRMATDGDLADLLAEHRGAARKFEVTAALDSLRKGPQCDHGVSGGASLHPASGEPLCPQCRFRARIPKARPA